MSCKILNIYWTDPDPTTSDPVGMESAIAISVPRSLKLDLALSVDNASLDNASLDNATLR